MAKTYDIQKFRQKKERRRWLFRIIWIFAGLVLVAGLVYASYVVRVMNNELDQSDSGFPVNLKGETPLDLNATDDSLVVTTAGSVLFYSRAGTRQSTAVHGFTKPVTRTNSGYAVTYDQGGYGVRLDTKSAGKTLKTQNQILFCEVNSDGKIAVATTHSKYASVVTVYDKDFGEPVFEFFVNEYAMALSFSGSNQCVLAAQDVEGGSFHTVLYGLDFKKEQPVFEGQTKSSMIFSVSVRDNREIVLVCSDGLMVFNNNAGTLVKQHTFENKLLFLETSASGYTVAAQSNLANPNQTDLIGYGAGGEQTGQVKVDGIVRDLFLSGSKTLVLDEHRIYTYDTSLAEVDRLEHNGEYRYIASIGGSVYALAADRMEKVD